ncbi:MAG: hypothetical protein ACXVAX_00360 [Pseudobdellovibrio sp.]
MKNLILTLTVLFSMIAKADDFVESKALPEKTACSISKGIVNFSELKQSYKLYEKNAFSTNLIKCEKVKINDQTFYTIMYNTALGELGADQKVLIYEVATLNPLTKAPKTVRSEVIDQLDQSGDSAATQFQSSVKAQWGASALDKSVLLKLTIESKNEKPFSYQLKYNPKSLWFINKF